MIDFMTHPELSHARGPTEPAVLDETLGDLLRRAAAAVPTQAALFSTSDDRRWTYAQLLADSEALARALLQRFQPGERIAIWAQNLPEWVLAEFALGLAGLPIVTVNPTLSPEEAAFVLRQSDAAAVIASTAYRSRDLADAARELQPECPDLREVITVDRFPELIREGLRLNFELPTIAPGDVAMIQYTSGTTGFPKGAMLHHRGIVTNAFHARHHNKAEPGDVLLGVMPLF